MGSLVAAGHDVTVLDDLSTGRAEAVPKNANFVYGTLRDDAKQALGETPDGTCIRDYIHGSDLADARLLALAACEPGAHQIYNLGNEAGFSVRQVIDMCSEVTERDIPAEVGPRRPGDPSRLIASSARIQEDLDWRPVHDLRDMVADHWQFTQARAALRAARRA